MPGTKHDLQNVNLYVALQSLVLPICVLVSVVFVGVSLLVVCLVSTLELKARIVHRNR